MAGGSGTRLWPLTKIVTKQLLHIYDKPLIYYPLSTLMLAGIREIMIICKPNDLNNFKSLLKDGSDYGIEISYGIQEEPTGIAAGFNIAKNFIGGDSVSLILGDNIFYGQGLGSQLSKYKKIEGCQIFAYKVPNPSDSGVVQISADGKVLSIEEKPRYPKSKMAVTGLYFYDNKVFEYVKSLKPSARGELEITDINNIYLDSGSLKCEILERGVAWLDTGTFEGLYSAASFIRAIEQRQGLKIACLEEIAWRKGWLDSHQLLNIVEKSKNQEFRDYITALL